MLVLRSGFLQVRENWEFKWSGKGQGKVFFFEKVRENGKLVPADVRFSG